MGGGFVALADGAGAAVSNEELVSGTNGAGAGGASSLAGAGGRWPRGGGAAWGGGRGGGGGCGGGGRAAARRGWRVRCAGRGRRSGRPERGPARRPDWGPRGRRLFFGARGGIGRRGRRRR